MRPRETVDPDEVLPLHLEWANKPEFDPENPDRYEEWVAERVGWFADRGISLLDHLRDQCQRSAS